MVREIVLGGLAAIQHCTIADVENLSESTIAAYIHGIEDEKSADVSLTALKVQLVSRKVSSQPIVLQRYRSKIVCVQRDRSKIDCV